MTSRRRVATLAGALAVGAAVAAAIVVVAPICLEGGPLRPLGGHVGGGAPIPAELPVGQPIYLTAPKPDFGLDIAIERISVQGASPGVRIVRTFVVTHGPAHPVPDAGFYFGKPPGGPLVEPPASLSIGDCCEPADAFAVEFELEDPGPHSIGALSIDYRAGLLEYHAIFWLGDWGFANVTPTE